MSLRRRYLSLGLGELAAAGVFAAVAVGVVVPRLEGPKDSAALWSALAPLLVVLVQAGVYWLLARGWVEQAPMPARLATLYRVFRVLDIVVLAVGLLGVLIWLPDHFVTVADNSTCTRPELGVGASLHAWDQNSLPWDSVDRTVGSGYFPAQFGCIRGNQRADPLGDDTDDNFLEFRA